MIRSCTHVVLAVLGLWALAGPQAAPGQTAETPAPLEVRVYTLKYLQASDARAQVEQIFSKLGGFNSVTLATDERTNSLICRAPLACHAEIAGLLQRVDVESAAIGAENQLTYPLKYREASRVAAVLEEVRSPRLQVAFDSEANMIILRGPQADLVAAQRLLQEMDTGGGKPSEEHHAALLVSVYFLRARFGAAGSCQLSGGLEGVAEALAGHGVGECRLLGHVMARVREGEDFNTQGVVGTDAVGAGPAQIEVGGVAEAVSDGIADLTIEGRLKVPVEVRSDGDSKPQYQTHDFGINTTTRVPLGDYLVLGAIPTKIEDSDTVILVIRIQ